MRLYFKVSQPHRRIASLLCLLTLLLWNLSDAIAQTKSLPIQGRIGVGTWETQAEFKDIKVTSGNKVLFESDFTNGLADWTVVSGQWKTEDGVLRQTSNEQGARVLVGDPDWNNYTVTLKARKLSGKEGFLVLFGVPDNTTNSWWNVGGWGGTSAAFQSPFMPEQKVQGRIDPGVWIDIKLEVKGNAARGFFNNRLVQTVKREANVFTTLAPAREVKFDTRDLGEKTSLGRWGLDTAWPSPDNMRRGIAYMGKENVDIVRVAFPTIHPFVNGQLHEAGKAEIENRAALARMAGDKAWVMLPDNGGGINPWFRNGDQFIADRWVAVMAAAQQHYGKKMESVEPFNEPDFDQAQGNAENLWKVLGELKDAAEFKGVKLAGPSLLNVDLSPKAFKALSGRLDIATTHTLAGSMENYIRFIEAAAASGAEVQNPELHNVGEAIMGAEYGLGSAIWWGTAELTRGEFVKASRGTRLAYAEDRPRWTCAAVYRTPSGTLQAFAAGSERMAATTSYRFVAADRDVFFNGYGPQRSFTVTVPGGLGYQAGQPSAERVINITWGEDVPPPIQGRYVIVNRATGKVLDVDQANLQDGGRIQQWTYSGAENQLWDVAPVTSGGDLSYFSILAAHSGKALDTTNRNYEEGGAIQQWGRGDVDAQQWYLEYAGNNDFYIRSRWSTKCLGVPGDDAGDGIPVQQFSKDDRLSLKWRMVPVSMIKGQPDFQSPLPASDLRTQMSKTGVQLEWEASESSDVFGYNVYRSSKKDGPYETIARGIRKTTYLDKKATKGQVSFYRIKTMDHCLNLSDNCQPSSTAE